MYSFYFFQQHELENFISKPDYDVVENGSSNGKKPLLWFIGLYF